MGAISVSVTSKDVLQQLDNVVVGTDAPVLLGRMWIAAFHELGTLLHSTPGVDIITIVDSTISVLITNMCDEFHDLFAPCLGKLVGYQAHIYVKPDAKFRFHKIRPVAFSIS